MLRITLSGFKQVYEVDRRLRQRSSNELWHGFQKVCFTAVLCFLRRSEIRQLRSNNTKTKREQWACNWCPCPTLSVQCASEGHVHSTPSWSSFRAITRIDLSLQCAKQHRWWRDWAVIATIFESWWVLQQRLLTSVLRYVNTNKYVCVYLLLYYWPQWCC